MANQLSTQPYKGTRDFYPEDMQVRNFIFNKIRSVLKTFGYLEYDGPMLEPFELYASKTSEEIVNEQLYWLVDRGERKLAIRPEMTPTLARMVASKSNELAKPIRWFSIPNLWRYERPQRGRLREHWQLNVDVFGGLANSEDLEICQIIAAIMHTFGATKDKLFEVRLNHRALSNHIFKEILKFSDERIPVIGRLLDAAPKMGVDAFQAACLKEKCTQEQIQTMLALLDKNAASNFKSQLENTEGYIQLSKLLHQLEELGLKNYFRYDPSIMRGFMYYTGMVLEVYDLHPDNNRALFGGGRYDNLVGMFGGKPLPGVGFGMGDVTFKNFLESHGLLPDLKKANGIYIAHLSENEFLPAQKLASELRHEFGPNEVSIMTALESDKVKKHFISADRLNARCIIFIGSEEVQSNKFKMKDLILQTQHEGNASSLAKVYLENSR